MLATKLTRTQLIQQIADDYFGTRPNLSVAHEPIGIFFLACAGAGKTTLCKQLVERLQLTYLSNDEVKELLTNYPEAAEMDVHFSEVIKETWKKILRESPNKAVVFDTSIITHYAAPGSYSDLLQKHSVPRYVINIDLNAEQLRARIILRGQGVTGTLGYLQQQLRDYQRTLADMTPDWTRKGLLSSNDIEDLVNQLSSQIIKK